MCCLFGYFTMLHHLLSDECEEMYERTAPSSYDITDTGDSEGHSGRQACPIQHKTVHGSLDNSCKQNCRKFVERLGRLCPDGRQGTNRVPTGYQQKETVGVILEFYERKTQLYKATSYHCFVTR